MKKIFSILALGMTFFSQYVSSQVLIEAESLGSVNGWVIDQQAFEQMGSAYLMANGIGVPLPDVSRTVKFPKEGQYHAFIRTYNWTSPWYNGKGPGKIQLLVDGKALPTILGETGSKWEWQYAGLTAVKQTAEIGLRDLTGFNGRVDAIYFSNKKIAPPNDKDSLATFRRDLLGFKNPIKAPQSDLVIVGGGMSGISAALTAARLGIKVTLIQNRPVLGGNNSPEVRVSLSGSLSKNLYPKLGNIVRELTGIPIPLIGYKAPKEILPKPSKDGSDEETASLRIKIIEEEKNINLYLNTHVFEVRMEGESITAVIGRCTQTGKETIFTGKYFVDATGDGTIGYLSGADYHIGREDRDFANEPTAPLIEDDLKMGMSVRWKSEEVENAGSFPTVSELPWAMQCSEDYYRTDISGRWFWETGMNKDIALEAELVRDNGLRSIYGNWAYLKNNVDKFKNRKIMWLSHIGGKRESRRLLGDLILGENDIINEVKYPDASYTTTWSIDLHYAKEDNSKHFPGWEWITYCEQPKIEPYHVPYRTLYSRNIENLFMVGRCVSVTHVALGTVRVMATGGMMGEVVGMAAVVCVANQATPRQVYTEHFDLLKAFMLQGVPTKENALQLKSAKTIERM